MDEQKSMTRVQVARVLRKHRVITELANNLGCHRVTVSSVLRGRMVSARIMAAATAKAVEILGEVAL